MSKILRLPDYINSFNFIHISDKGSYYLIEMYATKSNGDDKYRKLDGSDCEDEKYFIEIDKKEPKIYY